MAMCHITRSEHISNLKDQTQVKLNKNTKMRISKFHLHSEIQNMTSKKESKPFMTLMNVFIQLFYCFPLKINHLIFMYITMVYLMLI